MAAAWFVGPGSSSNLLSLPEQSYEEASLRAHPPRAVFDNGSDSSCTLLKVASANRRGVLLQVVQLLTDLDLVIRKAHISSDGCWFVDVFYITDQRGRKVTDKNLIHFIQQCLGASTNGSVTEARTCTGRTLVASANVPPDATGHSSTLGSVPQDPSAPLLSSSVPSQLAQGSAAPALPPPNSSAALPLTVGRAVRRPTPRVVEPAATGSEAGEEALGGESWRDRLAVELTAPDRVGLLHDVAASLADTGWNVVGADVWTNKGRAACILHVTERDRRRRREEQEQEEQAGQEGNRLARSVRSEAGGPLFGPAQPMFERESPSPMSVSPDAESPGPLPSPASGARDDSGLRRARVRNSLLADSLQGSHQALPGLNARSSSAGSLMGGGGGKGESTGARRRQRVSLEDVRELQTLLAAAAGKEATVRVCSIGEGAPAGGTETERRLHKLLTAAVGDKREWGGGAAVGGGGKGEEREGGAAGVAAEVSVKNSEERRYTIVNICCADRPKLLFDALCVITDMTHVIHHASVESENGVASQEYFIRKLDGDMLVKEAEREHLLECLRAAVLRRSPEGVCLELCMSDKVGLLAEVTNVLSAHGMSITSAAVHTRMGKAVNEFYVISTKGKHRNVDFEMIETVRRKVGPSVLVVRNAPKEITTAIADKKQEDQVWTVLGDAFMNILGLKK